MRIGSYDVKITRPGKILFPEDGITKGDLIEYYRRIARWMLPHLRGRPIMMQRYPDGIDKPGFFQKAAARYYPDWIETATVEKVGGTVKHVICENVSTLIYLANQACITPHVWLSRVDRLDYPDQMIFDLDPSGGEFAPIMATAQSLKHLLDELELPAYLKTTGSRGLHVAVPLNRKDDFESVRAFARELARLLVSGNPDHRTLELRKSMRHGRVFVDTNRNAYAQTVAPAYAVRAYRGAPISVPLDWGELRKKDLRSDGVTLRTIFDRLERLDEPWKDFRQRATALPRAWQRLSERNATRGVSKKERLP
jgi:bifunctional non-homologous end joining protein LigD